MSERCVSIWRSTSVVLALLAVVWLAACGGGGAGTSGGDECPMPELFDNDVFEATGDPADATRPISYQIDTGDCTPLRSCPHRGGDAVHDACADGYPPNDGAFQTCDVRVMGKYFDAIKTWSDGVTKTLWEIKTWNYSSYKKCVQDWAVARAVKEAVREKAIAGACGYDYNFVVTDHLLADHMSKALERNGQANFPLVYTQACGVGR